MSEQHPNLHSPDINATTASAPAAPDQPKKKKQTSALREILETALLAILIFVSVRSVVLNFKVDGSSMQPTFHTGEMILVNRNAYREFDLGDLVDWIPGVPEQHWVSITDWGSPGRGDVVVFTPPPPGQDKPYIKRVIGVAGDRVQITPDREVLVNGIAIDEPYTGDYYTDCGGSQSYCDTIVPEGHVFVMGDHRTNSEDSRYFGPVSEDRIIGKAWLVYWPTDVFGPVDHPEYPELEP